VIQAGSIAKKTKVMLSPPCFAPLWAVSNSTDCETRRTEDFELAAAAQYRRFFSEDLLRQSARRAGVWAEGVYAYPALLGSSLSGPTTVNGRGKSATSLITLSGRTHRIHDLDRAPRAGRSWATEVFSILRSAPSGCAAFPARR